MAGLMKRGKIYYEVYYVGGKQKRTSLETTSLQIAKEKIRQHESARFRGEEIAIPTKTPIAEVVQKFIKNLCAKGRGCNVIKDIYSLREAFGPICPELKCKNQKISEKSRKKRRATKVPEVIKASCFEWIRTPDIAAMIRDQKNCKNLKGKTANHLREILVRLFAWAMKEGGVNMPGNVNPAAGVGRYPEEKPVIRFLRLPEIDRQLEALKQWEEAEKAKLLKMFEWLAAQGKARERRKRKVFAKMEKLPALKTMVAIMIYAGLRREEVCWLMKEDVDLLAGKNGMIRVQAKEVDGKYWQPKTGENRVVPISRALRGYLDTYVSDRETSGVWFFESPEGTRWERDNFSGTLREANKENGLAWSCLDFR